MNDGNGVKKAKWYIYYDVDSKSGEYYRMYYLSDMKKICISESCNAKHI